MKPNGGIAVFGLMLCPPASTARACSTAQSSELK